MRIRIKQFIAIVLSVILTVTVFGDTVQAGTGDTSDVLLTSGDYQYELKDGKVTITDYLGAGGNITLPTTLGGYPVVGLTGIAFISDETITGVTLPSAYKSIPDYAFSGCKKLEKVNIQGNITSIGVSAFYQCYELTQINLPDSITSIGEGAFTYCSSLVSLTIPKDITVINSMTFAWCDKLETINLPSGLKTINTNAFIQCGVKSMTIPPSVEKIDCAAFAGCDSLTDVSFPDTTENPSQLTTLGSNRFGQESSGVFYGCSALRTITLPKGITTIVEYNFMGCSGLQSVQFPSTLNSIERYAFDGCTSLESVTFPSSVKAVSYSAFGDCTSLVNVTMNEGLTNIGDYVFYKTAIVNISIPSSLNKISEGMFSCCEDLKNVTIPVSVTAIENNAFFRGYSLENIYYAGTNAQWKAITIEYENDCMNLAAIHCSDDQPIDDWVVSVDDASTTYNGEEQKPVVTVTSSGTPLTKDVDFSVEYENNINAGTEAKAIVKGLGCYKGVINKYFTIARKSITSYSVDVEYFKTIYDGSEKEPWVWIFGLDSDGYTLEYEDNINVGTGKAIIEGKGNYIGKIIKTFEIVKEQVDPIDLSKKNAKLSFTQATYSGKAIKPSVTVEGVDSTNYKVSYSNNINPGKATVTITGIKDYVGTITKTFTILPKSISAPTVKLSAYNKAAVSWTKSTGASGYRVYYKKSTTSSWSSLNSTKNSVTLSNLSAGAKYQIRVVPYVTINKVANYTTSSPTKTISTLKSIAAPTVKKYNAKKVTVKWKNIDGESGYQISKSTSKKGTTIVSTYATTSGKSKIIKAAKKKTFYYKVRAYVIVGKKKIFTPWSSVKSFKLK